VDREHVQALPGYGGLAGEDRTLQESRLLQAATADGVPAGEDVGDAEGGWGEEGQAGGAGVPHHGRVGLRE
jgi:hypothetical protein